jgi:hypothetical protein
MNIKKKSLVLATLSLALISNISFSPNLKAQTLSAESTKIIQENLKYQQNFMI